MLPQLMVMGTGPAVAEPSLVVLAEAVLFTVPQSFLVVALVTWTCRLAPGARSMGPKLREFPESVQVPVVLGPSTDQLRSAPGGRVSETDTLRAVPAPVLDTVMT